MPTPDPITLNFRPSIFHSISWSSDAELAIAAGDFVEILLPKYKSPRQWDNIRFHADVFTQAEFSSLPLPSMAGFSLGEESHISNISNLQWSGPGIAKHRRCALGVLTSNHMLCVYASEGNPRDLLSWKRVMAINEYMKMYWEEVDSEMDDFVRRKRARVMGFAWSECVRAASEKTPQQAFLAVSNDNHEVLIIKIKSSYGDDQHSHGSWETKVLAHFDARGPHCLELSGNSPFGHIPVKSLSLSPWIRKTEGSITVHDTIVAYTSHEYAGLRRLSVYEDIGSDVEVNIKVGSQDVGSYCGWIGPGSSIKWDLQTYMNDEFQVRGMLSTPFSSKYFSEYGFEKEVDKESSSSSAKSGRPGTADTGDDDVDLIQTDPSFQAPGSSTENLHSRRACGVEDIEQLAISDPISGIAITPLHPNSPFTSGLIENTHHTRHHAIDSWYQDFPPESPLPTWIRTLDISNMNKSQITSTWGLALSPASSIIAIITTAQAADTIEFLSSATATCTIHFSPNPRRIYHSLDALGNVSTEGLVFEATYGDYGVRAEDFPYRKKLLEASKSLAMQVQQKCVFCEKEVRIVDEENSACLDGHSFDNCGSTSLAIQGPGLTRSCGICGYRCLKPEEIRSALGERRLEIELAGISGDLCGYCGGKFVD